MRDDAVDAGGRVGGNRDLDLKHGLEENLLALDYPPEKLKEAFKEFSEKNIDIELIAALKPSYEQPPSIDPEGKLVIKGYFPTEPIRGAAP